MISRFRGQYEFLSNFYESPISYNGVTYRNAEAAFQAQKCPSRINEFTDLSASQAKRLGRKVNLREDWDDSRISIMEDILRSKFQDPDLKQKLINTGDNELIEGNNWKDRFWGVDGTGQNNLGKLLMKIREDIK